MPLLKTLTMCLAMASASSFAGDFYGVANLASYHVKTAKYKDVNYNEKTFGFGLEYVGEKYSYQIGRFKNSVFHTSHYIAAAYTPIHFSEKLRLGAMLGIVDGYPKHNNGGISPLAGLLLQFNAPIGFNVLLIPPTAKNATTFDFQIKVRF